MYILYDTFNKKVLSRHRKIEAAARAANKHQRAVTRHHGKDSFIPISLRHDDFDCYGEPKKACDSDLQLFWHRQEHFK